MAKKNTVEQLTQDITIRSLGDLIAPLSSTETDWRTRPRAVTDLMACWLNVSEVGAAIQRRIAGTLANPPSFNYDENDQRAAAACELVRDQFENIPRLNRHLGALLLGKSFGLGAVELMWESAGAGYRLSGMAEIDIRRLGRTDAGEIYLRSYPSDFPERNVAGSLASPESVIPPAKLCLLSTSERDFRGPAYMDRVYIPARSLWLAQKFWLMTTERFGSPTIIAKHISSPGTWQGTEVDKDLIPNFLAGIRANSWGELPPGVEVELLEADLRGAQAGLFKDLADHFATSVRKLILSSDLTMDAGERGARALGEVQERGENDILAEDAQDLEDCLQSQVVNRILELNGFEPDLVKIDYSVAESLDLARIAEFVSTLQRIGLPLSIKWVRDVLGDVPAPESAEDTLSGNGDAPAPGTDPVDPSQLSLDIGAAAGKAFYQLALGLGTEEG